MSRRALESQRLPQRILILGCPGAGKSTLARQLGTACGLPVYHLDDEYWQENWARPQTHRWESRQRQLAAQPQWIIEGNQLPTIPLRAARAEGIIIVDAPLMRCLHRVLVRAWRIRFGEYALLPRKVRAQANAGHAVPATKDFYSLLRKILLFRLQHWWPTVARAETNPAALLIVAVDPDWALSRAAAIRRKLQQRGIAAHVLPISQIPACLRDWNRSKAERCAQPLSSSPYLRVNKEE